MPFVSSPLIVKYTLRPSPRTASRDDRFNILLSLSPSPIIHRTASETIIDAAVAANAATDKAGAEGVELDEIAVEGNNAGDNFGGGEHSAPVCERRRRRRSFDGYIM
jgi:hypothetical protein